MLFSLIASALILLICIIAALKLRKTGYKPGRVIDSSKCLFIGVVLSTIIMFIPIYTVKFKSSDCGIFETVLISIHNMIRLFVVDGDFDFITSNLPNSVSPWIVKIYVALFAVLFVLAPILTFGFLLSFFKDVSAYRKWICNKAILNHKSEIYVFSELNDKSIALAKSFYRKKPKKTFIAFTDVFENEEKDYELIERAKKLRAACFKKDITAIDFFDRRKKDNVKLFVLSENNSENIVQVLKLYEKYKNYENFTVFFFSTQSESEIYLVNAYKDIGTNESKGMKIRRVNEVQSLIYYNLYETGYENIFQSALSSENREGKQINAVVVGMGLHGTEMTKALTWFCQMDGYRVKIDSFDKDELAEEKFTSQCPELIKYSDNNIPTESKYSLAIHSSMDADTISFDSFISKLCKTTYVFVALGDDEKNLSVSVKLRSLFERMNISPVIQTIIYNSDVKKLLGGIKNFKKQEYNIDFIGDIESQYSDEVILNSEVEEQAKKLHLKYAKDREEDFWRYDYNYRSSTARVIHRKMKKLCGMAEIDKPADERSAEARENLRVLEHRRWNAFVRSEGYIYGGTTDKKGRNDLAKTHNCLVTYDKVPEENKINDDD